MLLRRTSSPTGEGHLTSVSSSKFLPQIKELPEMNFKSLSKVLERPTLYLFPTCAKSAAPSFWLFQKWPTVHPISLYFFSFPIHSPFPTHSPLQWTKKDTRGQALRERDLAVVGSHGPCPTPLQRAPCTQTRPEWAREASGQLAFRKSVHKSSFFLKHQGSRQTGHPCLQQPPSRVTMQFMY